jgi:hypothetical protein
VRYELRNLPGLSAKKEQMRWMPFEKYIQIAGPGKLRHPELQSPGANRIKILL